MLSRYPLAAGPQVDPENDWVLRAVVSVGTRKLVVLGTYIATPFPGERQDWEFAGLTRIMKAQPSNAVLVGDFNSVFWSPNMAHYITASGVAGDGQHPMTEPTRPPAGAGRAAKNRGSRL